MSIDTLRIEGNPATLYESLAKAQTEFLPIPKTNAGQIGKRDFKYAGYATVMRCVRPALAKYGISVLQPLHSRGAEAVTTTILAGHGAAIISSMSFPSQKDPQEFGRHHTYYRRYQLQAMLGLEGDKDADDLPDVNEEHASQQGFAEQAPAPKKEEKKEPKPAAAPKAAPKATVSAEPKPAAVTQPTLPSVQASGPTTAAESDAAVPSPEKIVEGIPPEKLNGALSAVMKQMSPPWKVIDIRNFYANYISDQEMPAPDSMDPALKRRILAKIIEVEKVAPF